MNIWSWNISTVDFFDTEHPRGLLSDLDGTCALIFKQTFAATSLFSTVWLVQFAVQRLQFFGRWQIGD